MPRRRRASRSSRAVLLAGPAAALVCAGALLALDGRAGLGALRDLRETTADARARVAELEAERAELRARVSRLHDDPLELEAVAREQLGMLRSGEIVVRFGRPGAPD